MSGFLFFANEVAHQSSTILDSSIETQSFKVKNNIRAEIIGANHCLKRLIDEIKLIGIDAKNLEINLYSDCQTLTNLLLRREKLTAQNCISGKTKAELANADPQAGKRLIQALLHLFGIALVAAVNRPLRAQPQMLEQAAHSTLAHFHAVLLL